MCRAEQRDVAAQAELAKGCVYRLVAASSISMHHVIAAICLAFGGGQGIGVSGSATKHARGAGEPLRQVGTATPVSSNFCRNEMT